MPRTALEALRRVARDRAMTRGQVRETCQATYGVDKFSDLSWSQQWGLVFVIDPEASGPYGHSMEAF